MKWIGELVIAAAVIVLASACLNFSLVSATTADASEIRKSENDSREYRSLTLENGLSVFLIHDSGSKKAAASLDIAIGNGSDPVNRQGLAHFLEHMLFLGTSKYPDAGEYHSFISRHGGYANALTYFGHTNYHFDIEAEYLEPALDRFSSFFVSPLFSDDLVEREKNAVHAEYTAKRRDDERRIWDARKQVMNPDHPMSHFDVGSLDTLEDRVNSKIRDELIVFYRAYYSSNIMMLSVYGSDNLDELESLARRYFEAVPNLEREPRKIGVPMYSASTLPSRLDVRPLNGQRSMTLSFEVNHSAESIRTKPYVYISELLGHEGEVSLLSMLKQLGYANKLRAGRSAIAGGVSLFSVDIGLTRHGMENVDEIVSMVFSTINLVKHEGVSEKYHDELK